MRGMAFCFLAAALAACAAPPGALARAQEAAQELNLDTRFGRTELAMDRVAPSAREAFAAHHRAWGTAVRVADVELAGMHAKGERTVEVVARVAWDRPDQRELRLTPHKHSERGKDGYELAPGQV